MTNANLPPGCTDRDTDGGLVKQPTDEQVHAYACEDWRYLLCGDAAFEDAEVLGCYKDTPEETDVFLTVRVRVPWVDVEI